jgi:hypothetical protein
MQNPFVASALDNVREAPADLILSNPSPSQPTKWKVQKHPKTGSIITDTHLRIQLVPQSPISSSSSPSSSSEEEGKDGLTATHPSIFALGDCASIPHTSYPATAQVASQQALWLAKALNATSRDTSISSRPAFSYKDLGTLAYIGNWNALWQGGKGGRLRGYLAWIVWRGAYVTRTVSWRNKILVPVYWVVNWVFGRDISRF